LDGGFAVKGHVGSGMVVVEEPAAKGQFQLPSGVAVDGGVLLEPSALHQLGEVFEIHLEQVSRPGDDEGAVVSLGPLLSLPDQAGPFKYSVDADRPRGMPEPSLALKGIPEPKRPEVSLLAKPDDLSSHGFLYLARRPIGSSWALQKGVGLTFGLSESGCAIYRRSFGKYPGAYRPGLRSPASGASETSYTVYG